MNTLKKLGYITSGLASLYIAYITATGEILNYVPFADPLNEMGFFILCIMMGPGLLCCSSDTKTVNN